MSNLEAQENELLSLQSIFEEKEFFLDGMDPPSGRIAIEARLPDGFYVAAVKRGAGTLEEVFQVDHLPPINLLFQFPASYPLETCPAFLLSCNWLSLHQLSVLCKHLEYLWEMNMDAILYTWMQFLQEEALDFLNISQCLDVSELLTFKIKDNFRHRENDNSDDCSGGTDNHEQSNLTQLTEVGPSVSGGSGAIDLRAFNELSDGKRIVQLLKDFNEYKIESVFYTTIQECDVCFLKKQGSEFIKFNKCKHYFCRDCVKEYFEGHIKDGSVNSLKCLQSECDTQLDGSTVKELVRSDLFDRYDRLLLSTTLESMSDIAYCPRQDCQCACIIDTCGRMGTCSACSFVFCPFCKMTYHGVAPCNFKSGQRKQIFEEYINGNSSVKEGIEKRYGKRVIKSLIEDTLSESWKSSNSKCCPHCRASIEKTEGCNKMTCFRCGSFFCWLCMKVLSGGNPYSHYSNRASECYNLLFPEDYMNNEFLEEYEVIPGEYLNGFELL